MKKLAPITISKLAEELGEDKRVKQVLLSKQDIEVLRAAAPLWKNAQNQLFNTVGENDMVSILKEWAGVVSLIAPSFGKFF